ncbi:MAG TPA: enoyl-CoA hydratase/isomerase family protein [Gemmatimonadales bacterium]|nr:enoyl-CoA hydratase/isomerase family protein [Gemmatimonadales bacterium]
MGVTRTTDGGVARLHMSWPPLNILTRAALAELRAAVAAAATDATLRVLLLTAEGRHFSAGADVREHLPPDHEALIPEFLDTIAAIARFPVPVVAAVRGRCLGGGFEVVQAADLIVAGEGASFGQPEIVLGVLAPAACVLLPRIAGSQGAAEIMYTGDPIPAPEALRLGIVRRVVPDGEVEDAAAALARRIARHSAATLRLARRALRSPPAFREVAALYRDDLMATADAVEGLRAFVEKRDPVWSHR